MVNKFSSVGGLNKVKALHHEILRWLENNPVFQNCSVFMEFHVPSWRNFTANPCPKSLKNI